MPSSTPEVYFSVDIETAGPIPGEYSMLSVGACVVGDTANHFYCELQPLNDNYTQEALDTCELDLAELRAHGAAPADGMEQFAAWVEQSRGYGHAVFVGFNAAFDWSFVNYYFEKFLGHNPFGHAALDIKSYYMGKFHTTWKETSMRKLPPDIHPPDQPLAHNALEDAIQQAEIFARLLGVGSEIAS